MVVLPLRILIEPRLGEILALTNGSIWPVVFGQSRRNDPVAVVDPDPQEEILCVLTPDQFE